MNHAPWAAQTWSFTPIFRPPRRRDDAASAQTHATTPAPGSSREAPICLSASDSGNDDSFGSDDNVAATEPGPSRAVPRHSFSRLPSGRGPATPTNQRQPALRGIGTPPESPMAPILRRRFDTHRPARTSPQHPDPAVGSPTPSAARAAPRTATESSRGRMRRHQDVAQDPGPLPHHQPRLLIHPALDVRASRPEVSAAAAAAAVPVHPYRCCGCGCHAAAVHGQARDLYAWLQLAISLVVNIVLTVAFWKMIMSLADAFDRRDVC